MNVAPDQGQVKAEQDRTAEEVRGITRQSEIANGDYVHHYALQITFDQRI
jgi:hypothetical protein